MIYVLFLFLTSCAYAPALPEDEFGHATRCHWIGQYPVLCRYDPSRVTVDRQTLQEMMDTLEQQELDAITRRSL
jgi:hypothetical protein